MKKIVEARETSRGKVREIVGLSAPMNEIVRPTYLSNTKEYFIVTATNIEGGHCLPLESSYLLDQLQCIIKAIKCWCGYIDILKNVNPQVFLPCWQAIQWKVERA